MSAPPAPLPLDARARNGEPAAMLEMAVAAWASAPETARDWLRRAAATWHLPARLELGRRLLAGDGFVRDPVEGRAVLGTIAGRSPAAALALRVPAGGEAAPPDDPAACARLRAAAAAGDTEAWYELGLRRCLASSEGAHRPTRVAFYAAARRGHARAVYQLARVILAGVGTVAPGARPGDAARGVAWLARAAAAGVPEALEDLADLYQAGRFVPQDSAAARGWLLRAAEVGSVPAAYTLGLAAYTGQGAPFDPGAACRWLGQAAAAGHGPANGIFIVIFGGACQDPADPAVRRAWLQAMAEHHQRAAFEPLAQMLEAGEGGPVDRAGAVRWLGWAARLGSAPAAEAAARLWLAEGADPRQDLDALEALLVAVDRAEEAEAAPSIALGPLLAAYGSLAGAQFALGCHRRTAEAGRYQPAVALAWLLAAGEATLTVPAVAVSALLAAAQLFSATRVMPHERFPSRAPRFFGCIPDRPVRVPDPGDLVRKAVAVVLGPTVGGPEVHASEPAAAAALREARADDALMEAAWRVWRGDEDLAGFALLVERWRQRVAGSAR